MARLCLSWLLTRFVACNFLFDKVFGIFGVSAHDQCIDTLISRNSKNYAQLWVGSPSHTVAADPMGDGVEWIGPLWI